MLPQEPHGLSPCTQGRTAQPSPAQQQDRKREGRGEISLRRGKRVGGRQEKLTEWDTGPGATAGLDQQTLGKKDEDREGAEAFVQGQGSFLSPPSPGLAPWP